MKSASSELVFRMCAMLPSMFIAFNGGFAWMIQGFLFYSLFKQEPKRATGSFGIRRVPGHHV
jgi:hypothetical protein